MEIKEPNLACVRKVPKDRSGCSERPRSRQSKSPRVLAGSNFHRLPEIPDADRLPLIFRSVPSQPRETDLERIVHPFADPQDFRQWKALLGVWAPIMKNTPQRPDYHAEGDVLTHTEMVCEAMTRLEAYRQADPKERAMLYLCALFHDIGKPLTTEIAPDGIHSPGHARVGTGLTRPILWQKLGLGGTMEKLLFRERICNLIRFHSLPPQAYSDPEAGKKLIRAAADGCLIPGLTVRNLCILSEADVRGRISPDPELLVNNVERCREMARGLGCFDGPYPFRSEYSRYAALSGTEENDRPWGEIVMVCGVPGTGKEAWLREHGPDLPMIVPDALRRERKLAVTDDRRPVLAKAREQAREYLRKKQPFIWCDAGLTESDRQNQLRLFRNSGASVKLLYLETDWNTVLRRNAQREDGFSEAALLEMQNTLVPPSVSEAHRVQWLCI